MLKNWLNKYLTSRNILLLKVEHCWNQILVGVTNDELFPLIAKIQDLQTSQTAKKWPESSTARWESMNLDANRNPDPLEYIWPDVLKILYIVNRFISMYDVPVIFKIPESLE